MVNINGYLTRVSNYFISKGNKIVIERLLYDYLIIKAKLKSKKFAKLLRKCNFKTTPLLYAKMRGKGKRTKYRIHPLSKKNKYIKSVQNLGLTVGAALRSKKTNSFGFTMERELGLWAQSRHPLRKKRLEVHRIAKKYAPYKWFIARKKRWKKIKPKPKPNRFSFGYASIYRAKKLKKKVSKLKIKFNKKVKVKEKFKIKPNLKSNIRIIKNKNLNINTKINAQTSIQLKSNILVNVNKK